MSTPPILPGNEPQAIASAAEALAKGKLVAMPTETVYGLAADADNASACLSIYAAKGRPQNHPLIVHVSGIASASHYAADFPQAAQRLAQAYWPGPLTLIVKRRAGVADTAASGQPTIGLRVPAHPVAQALIGALEALGGHGIAAPSANQFGRISPTTAQHVAQSFANLEPNPLALILDGGPCNVGIESTIIDCTRSHPILLRPGILTLESLETAAGDSMSVHASPQSGDPRASGTLASHYAPKAKVRLMSSEDIGAAAGIIAASKPERPVRIGIYTRHKLKIKKAAHVFVRAMPDEPQAAAHDLFAALHDFDAQGVTLLWIEAPPDTPEWLGVRDRLQRAAAA